MGLLMCCVEIGAALSSAQPAVLKMLLKLICLRFYYFNTVVRSMCYIFVVVSLSACSG